MLVRYPPPKTSEPADELPNPDLNPLLNPTLGRNLGRWAEVYFTSPPEKREEAVGELLRELKENPAAAAAEAEFAHDDLSLKEAVAALKARAFNQSSEVLTTTTSGVQCAECGHRHPAAQRFCGMCGAPLATDELDPQDYGQQPVVTVARREPDPGYHTSIFGLDTSAPVTQPPFSNGADINWLREKNLAGGSEGSSGFRKLIPALLAMAAIGILIYAQSRPPGTPPRPTAATTAPPKVENAPQSHPSQEAPPAVPASQAASSSPAAVPANPTPNATSVAENPTPAAPTTKQTTAPEKPAAPEAAPPVGPKVAPNPAPKSAPEAYAASATTPKPQPATADANAGAEDFALATEYLNGRRGPRDSAEAAKFLWKAVGKENPSAILLLSDMYLVGDGVPKSCDQARLLLNAAVRKSVPHAAQKLRNLQTAGCP
jgi:hypothetical protein